MVNPLLAPDLEELIAEGDHESLRQFCTECHPASVGEFLSALSPENIRKVLLLIDPALRAEIFSNLDEAVQEDTVDILSRDELAALLTEMPPDDRVHLFRRLPEQRQERVMPAIASVEREEIRRLIVYEEGTAGAIMTSDYATVPPDLTVVEAVNHLRQVAPDKETIYYAYVLDADRRLVGSVSLRELIVAPRQVKVRDLMQTEVVTSLVSDDQEEVVHKIQQYDLLALPIVNDDDVLVGIVTYDDAMDVQEQENTEDVEKMASIAGAHEGSSAYLSASPWELFRSRVVWIVAFSMVEMLSGSIILHYEDAVGKIPLLAAFIPMLTEAGGNTGCQSAAMVVRGLATGEFEMGDFLKIVWKEFGTALLLGLSLGVVAFGRAVLCGGGEAFLALARIALTIALAIGAQVVSATVLGAVLPLAASKLKLDPAVVSNPMLATIVDVTGLLIYFAIASAMLPL